MTGSGATGRPRAIVCGTKFGRVYLAALRSPGSPFELAGILARGGDRSRACARHYDVPLFTDPDEVPDDVRVACVVVGSGLNGGSGALLARRLMARGMHILQEHPLHHDELADCLRQARQNGVVYRLNTHYVHLAPVRRFVRAARALGARQRPLFVDAVCAYQVAYALFDILGEALDGLRPWDFAASAPDGADRPLRSLDGCIGGVPLTLRIQNWLDPEDPDNHAYLLHRITIGAEGGTLTLVDSHGPVLWSPRPYVPPETHQAVTLDAAPGEHLRQPSVTAIGPGDAPSYREITGSVWPDGVRTALCGLDRAIAAADDPLRRGRYYLALCRLWQDAMSVLGPPRLVRTEPPRPLIADELAEVSE